jgi:hypothetical protein
MSFVRNSGVSLFPIDFIKGKIQEYTTKHGKPPKILVLASEDVIDFSLTWMPKPQHLGVEKIQRANYLKSGEIELCQE